MNDGNYIWHPFTQMKTAGTPVHIVKGEGALLYDINGKTYIDAISSWWTNLHGHAHPYIAQKIYEQALQLEHVIFAGFTHTPALELAKRLIENHLPANQQKIFFSDNGSTAVEVAIKMALQFWYNCGSHRKKIIAFANAYHGDTFGSMSVSGRSAFTQPFNHALFDVVHIPAPYPGDERNALEKMEETIDTHTDIAAFIYEPLVQGAAGMRMYAPAHLDTLIALAKSQNIITIADEVMTGFYRTGKMFAINHCRHVPDILCLSKGLTGGAMALGITA
ncbi:MAG: aminotransferase class III-fold pyridoxal phosphate-dependent enzyme, partial [Chitinophagales bacterium]